MDIQVVDPDFIQMMDLKFLAGSDFSRNLTLAEIPEFTEDMTPARYLVESPRKYIINETAMRQLGWSDPRDAIGREVKWSIGSFELAYGPITGVVEDYHQESLKNEVDPIIMAVEPLWLGTFLVKVNGQQITQTLKEIERIWNDLFPYSFEFNFLDDLFDELYKKDQAKISLLLILTLVAITISFIGLISLVAFTLNTRSKELAIRRVIGANLTELIRLIGRDYFLFIGMASLLAIPISYYYVRSWLNDFAYHINISPFFYVQAVALIFFILLCILTIQVFKASRLNPVEALRED
ncbi:MAG: FtsX-like permease family protein [Saprospiraceae bacterium]|nr:FtsX-like permease family protein [Saprospiraceae bacterium]